MQIRAVHGRMLWDQWANRTQTEADGPASVLQDWVMELPRRFQGTLLTGIRGCDVAPKMPATILERYGCSSGESTPERHLSAFLRYCVLNPADPRETDTPGSWFQSRPPAEWRPSQFGHYPEHWYAHVMHCFEIIGYEHPEQAIATFGWDLYARMVRNLHLNPETRHQMWERLTEDRIAAGTVVS